MKKKLAVKGGISYGEVSLNKSEQIYFGQPIIDAYLLQEDVNFIGVVCHYTINEYMKINNLSSDINIALRFIETPLKSGYIKHLILDYYFFTLKMSDRQLDKERRLSEIKKQFEEFYTTVSGSPRRYIDNSIKLIDELVKSEVLFLGKDL